MANVSTQFQSLAFQVIVRTRIAGRMYVCTGRTAPLQYASSPPHTHTIFQFLSGGGGIINVHVK